MYRAQERQVILKSSFHRASSLGQTLTIVSEALIFFIIIVISSLIVLPSLRDCKPTLNSKQHLKYLQIKKIIFFLSAQFLPIIINI